MFAFVVAGRDGRFVAARDPVGIKPLYWSRPPGTDVVRFASEMHAFDARWREHVEPFPRGHAWTPEDGLVRFADAVPVDDGPPPPPPAGDELVEGTRVALVHAVERQLMGDVPVGVFLSGGLDSSLVAAIAARKLAERGERLQTFAVGTPDSPDLLAARRVAEHVGADHHETTYTAKDALEALPTVVRVIESFDPGLVRSAVPNFLLAAFTAQHVKVVLTGEGADELFAGYDYLRDFTDPRRAARRAPADDREPAQPQPPALRPRDDGPRPRGARAVPRPRGHPVGDARAARREGHGVRPAREGAPARGVHRLAARGSAVARQGGVRRRQRRARRPQRRGLEPVTDEELAPSAARSHPPLRTKEELAYFRIFREHLAGVRPEVAISRFARA
jgi:asparagine synthase (glutamine-hydrolysing)